MTIDRPILLLGPTRSGKSLIGQILSNAPGFALAFEPVTIWDAAMKRREDDVRSADDATDAVIARCRREIERFLVQSHCTRYVDDLPHHTLRLPFVRAVLPEAKFIVAIRHPDETIPRMIGCWRAKDTVGRVLKRRFSEGRMRSIRISSLPGQAWRWLVNAARVRLGLKKSTWGPTVPGQREFARTHSLYETVAYQWARLADFTAEALESLPPERVLLVRYEELVGDIERQAARIADFCEVGNQPAVRQAAEEILVPDWHPSNVLLTEAEWNSVKNIASAAAERLGYTWSAHPSQVAATAPRH